MNTETRTNRRTRPFYGWWIVLAGSAIVAYGLGAQGYVQSLLVRLVRDEFRGGPEILGSALAVLGLAGGIALLASGPLIDRFGPRRLMLIGIPIASAGFLGLSTMNTPFTLYAFGGLIWIGLSAGFLLPVQTATANWFERKRSTALAIVSAAALGGPLMAFVGQRIADQVAWRTAFLALGLGMLAVCVPLALVIRHRPEEYGYLPAGRLAASESGSPATQQESSTGEINLTLWEALRTRVFWLLTIAVAFSTWTAIVTAMYMAPFLTDRGFTLQTATEAFDVKPLLGLAGILIFGFLGDVFPKRHLLALAVAIQSLSVLILMTAGSVAQVYIYLLVFGMGSGIIPLMLAIRADYFGRKAFATITVVMILISGIIGMPLSALAPPLNGWLYNSFRSFEPGFLLSMVVGIIPAALFLLSKPPQQPRTSSLPANHGDANPRE